MPNEDVSCLIFSKGLLSSTFQEKRCESVTQSQLLTFLYDFLLELTLPTSWLVRATTKQWDKEQAHE